MYPIQIQQTKTINTDDLQRLAKKFFFWVKNLILSIFLQQSKKVKMNLLHTIKLMTMGLQG